MFYSFMYPVLCLMFISVSCLKSSGMIVNNNNKSATMVMERRKNKHGTGWGGGVQSQQRLGPSSFAT